jgi:hypothetical protein
MMTMNFSLRVPDLLYRELIERCTECSILPKQFAAECIEAALAARRLPHVNVGTHGAFSSGFTGTHREADADEHEDEDQDVEIEHKILL